MTTSIRSYSTSNRKCASITSSALLTSVAESTVIFLPIVHVGCLSASATLARDTRSAPQVRNGPRELGRPAARHALQDRAVLGVDGDDLAAALACRLGDQLAGHHQRFLVGEGDAFAGAQRRECRLESRGP